jgi:hypothetical protein
MVVSTLRVETGNVALVAPALTVTLPGTVATLVLLLLRVTTAPPDGAGEDNAAVPVEPEPPTTLAGFNVTDEVVVPSEDEAPLNATSVADQISDMFRVAVAFVVVVLVVERSAD